MEAPRHSPAMPMRLEAGDALVVVDVQRDFVSGSLAVPGAAAILPAVNRCVRAFQRAGLPIVATRDWHPGGHCSFVDEGGPWPAHCIAGTLGAGFDERVTIPVTALIVSKGTAAARDAYSAFEGTLLDLRLRALHVRRLFVCGLATDYCVLHTVLDARRLGYDVCVVLEAIAAVDVHPEDGAKAIAAMRSAGARTVALDSIVTAEALHG